MRTLREGDRGATVDLLQLGLHRAGLLGDAPDGIFGAKTVGAVLALQQKHALAADGVVGPQTWAVLYPFLTGFLLHPIAAGETLMAIAGRYDSNVAAILGANPGVAAENLRPTAILKIPLPTTVVPTGIRWSFDLLALVIDGLRVRYPFIAVEVLGSSVMGRPIYQLSIGSGKHRVGYNAAHHANEWITTPVLLQFLEQCAIGLVQGGEIGGVDYSRIFANYRLDIVPLVNPDGVDLVTGALAESTPQYQAAKRIAADFPSIPFPSGWKANVEGVDLNLSYPALWEKARQIKFAQGYNKPSPRDYVGAAPLAAPEAAAMHKYTLQADYRLTLAYHSQGELIYWKFADFNPAGSYALAQRMQGVSGYLPSVTPSESAYAGYKDWFIQQFNRPGYTIEVGQGSNPLPLTQFDQIYRDNVGILLLGMIGLDADG
ncbi:MAG: peptidoglycan-binding protein [Oscillospiraceae bacterium]|nr:peptidoglycan-binding protein [Oscillospiraceae bacterium]